MMRLMVEDEGVGIEEMGEGEGVEGEEGLRVGEGEEGLRDEVEGVHMLGLRGGEEEGGR